MYIASYISLLYLVVYCMLCIIFIYDLICQLAVCGYILESSKVMIIWLHTNCTLPYKAIIQSLCEGIIRIIILVATNHVL